MGNRSKRPLAGATAAAVALLLGAAPASATSFPVTSIADSGPNTLRQAITDANAMVDVDDIPINVTGTIDLADNLPSITTPMTITGPGADQLTVRASATGYGLVPVLTSNVAHTVRIEGITIADAQAPGFSTAGLSNGGTGLTVIDGVRLTNNATTTGSGAIHNSGRLTIRKSTLDDNEGDFGGGITSTGTAVTTVTNSTISGNRADEFGGGIYAAGTGSVTIASSTITDNKSNADNSGLSGDGGGIYSSAGPPFTLSVANTILAGNTVGSGVPPNPGLQCGGAAVTSLGYNLRETPDASCLGFSHPNDIGTATPGVGTLVDGGGPTPTVPLGSGSPAINAGYPACEATDQRGFQRGGGAGPCDIGAFELQPPVLAPIGDKTPGPSGTTGKRAAALKKCKKKKKKARKKCKKKAKKLPV